MKRQSVPVLLLCGLGIAGLVGCAGNHLDTLDSRIFMAPSLPETAVNSDHYKSDSGTASTAGDIETGPMAGELPKTAAVLPSPPAPTSRPFDAIAPIAELGSGDASVLPTTQPAVVQMSQTIVPQPMVNSSPTATDAPESHEVGLGVYMTLGGVIASVNQTPIYANQILEPLKKEFAVKARELSADAFRRLAEDEIIAGAIERIKDEQYFANDYYALTEEDRKLAELNAMMNRHRQIIAAGGSEELARHRAAEQGEDFDESIRSKYRWIVHQIYRQRLLEPLIEVSADDMRAYYNKNLDKLFSTKAQAQFRVIMIDPEHCKDGTAGAKLKINDLRDRAEKGEDFSRIAAAENDDDYLKSHAGYPGAPGSWIDRNSYRDDAVDAAVWQMQPGQITPVIEAGGKFYLAKLEARNNGIVRRFEDQDVQTEIQAKLFQLQMVHLGEIRKDEIENQAMVNFDPRKMQIVVDMAMQQYAQVQASGAGAPTPTSVDAH